jgi:gliding motility-associated-like protein
VYQSGGFYIIVLDESLSNIVFATYGQGSHVDGGTSRFDPKGVIYQGVCSGSGSFVGTPGAWAVNQSVGWDIGVFKIDFGLSTTLAAGATPNPTGCAPHTVEFNNYSTGNTFIWHFGDGTSVENVDNPTHVYNSPGDYQVMLIALDSTSCNIADTTYLNISIGIPFDLVPEFTYEYDCENLEIDLINSTESSGNPVNYVWNMGDGTTYYTYNANHVYTETGIYEITLTVLNLLCNEEETLSITVPVYQSITAEGAGAAVDFCVDATVQFAYTGNGANSHEWHFGDGNTGTGSFPLHTYAEPGTYDIALYVFNEFACETSDTTFFQVTIPPLPEVQAEFVVEQTGNCDDLGFNALSLSTGAVINYDWILNAETEYSGNPLTANVEADGIFELTLIVTEGICNFQDTISNTFELFATTGAAISPEMILCYNVGSINIDASAIYPDAQYLWSPGGETSPQITVSQTGIYTATISYNNCVEVLETEVKVGGEIPTDYSFESCNGFPVEIAIDFPVVEDPFWVDGVTDTPRIVTEAGVYPYEFTDHLGCRQFGEVTFNPLPDDPQIKIPNIFTPNADGQNDIFQPLGEELLYYSLTVFNRWGRTLFETNDIYGGWNGVIIDSEDPISEGNYFYIVRYQGECEPAIREKSGWVYVSR